MVRSRPTGVAANNRKTMDRAIQIFGKTMTHRLKTETKDANGRLTASSTSDSSFKGDLQYGPKIDRMYARDGVIDVGDAVLFVSANDGQAASISPGVSIVIEGATSGVAYRSWEVTQVINSPTIGGPDIAHFEFRCVRRNLVTLS